MLSGSSRPDALHVGQAEGQGDMGLAMKLGSMFQNVASWPLARSARRRRRAVHLGFAADNTRETIKAVQEELERGFAGSGFPGMVTNPVEPKDRADAARGGHKRTSRASTATSRRGPIARRCSSCRTGISRPYIFDLLPAELSSRHMTRQASTSTCSTGASSARKTTI